MTPAEVKAFNAGVEAAAKFCNDWADKAVLRVVANELRSLKKPEREDK